MSLVIQNINRLNHLLALFKLSKADLLNILNGGRVQKISEEEIFSSEIKLSLLKKIDKTFNKGISYYIDPSDLSQSKEESIFFRKDNFNASLNLASKQIVNKFEEEKLEIDTLLKLSDISKERLLPIFNVLKSPKEAALSIRDKIYPKEKCNDKSFLKKLIANLAKQNVLVFYCFSII